MNVGNTQRNANILLPDEARELNKVLNYADESKIEMEKLLETVHNMSALGLFWDSKIPENDKTLYNFTKVSNTSDRCEILFEIRQYQSFYEEIGDVVRKIIKNLEGRNKESVKPDILSLNEKMSKMFETAKSGKDSTDSSTIYELHNTFIEKQEKLENMIKKVECIALKYDFIKTTKDANQLLPDEGMELMKVSNYADEEKREMEKLLETVRDMSDLGLFWDSKIPENDKTLYNFTKISNSSDRGEILFEIKQYQSFYKDLGDVARKTIKRIERTNLENVQPLILSLKKKLSEIFETARLEKGSTGSSTLYDLHNNFIEKREILENMITKVECIALKYALEKATSDWKESLVTMKIQSDKMEESGCVQIKDTFEQFQQFMN